MPFFPLLARVRPVALCTALALPIAPGIAHAGFFDQLFGGGTVVPTQPSYSYEAPQSASPDLGMPLPQPRAKKKIVFHEETPVRQKTTDLMHDKTLRPGDAIMMKDGLHIYSGPEAAQHTARQFVPIDRSRVSSKSRASLLAMDTTRNDPLRKGAKMEALASGRSAAVSTPISNGFKITDARGKSIRYVGP